MSHKLQRVVDGQTILFLPIPKIFQNLSADLPSGAIKLPNGEVAYWRLHRNLSELKKNRKNQKDLIAKLVQALKSLVNSDAFLNHYGLVSAPEVANELTLTTLFRNLVQLNTKRVDYVAIAHDRKPLVESITIPLGNLVYCNAYRGIAEAPMPKHNGIKGKLWLNEAADEDKFFQFTVTSPVVNLADFMSADRLSQEILNRLKVNLAIMSHNPRLVFDDGQFEGFLDRGLQALETKHAAQQNGAGKKNRQQALTAVPPKTQNASLSGASTVTDLEAADRKPNAETVVAMQEARDIKSASFSDVKELIKNLDDKAIGNADLKEDMLKALELTVLDREHFDALSEEEKVKYVELFQDLADNLKANPASPKAGVIKAFLNSGILEAEREEHNQKHDLAKTSPYFLAVALGLSDELFFSVMGNEAPRFVVAIVEAEVPAGALAADASLEVDTSQRAGEQVFSDYPTQGLNYKVVSGDTLFGIAERAYGNGDHWPSIHLANKDKIEDPNLIHPDQVIFVPDLGLPRAAPAETANAVEVPVTLTNLEPVLLAPVSEDDAGREERVDAVVHARGNMTSMVHVDEAGVVGDNSADAEVAVQETGSLTEQLQQSAQVELEQGLADAADGGEVLEQAAQVELEAHTTSADTTATDTAQTDPSSTAD